MILYDKVLQSLNPFSFTEKDTSILITGASSGIGAALALFYARLYDYHRRPLILYLLGRDTERLQAVATQCAEHGATIIQQAIDVVDADKMAAYIAGRHLDVVIANAGISGGSADQHIESAAQMQHIFNVNINGVLNTILPAIEAMKTQKNGGQIAIMSSMAGYKGWPSAAAYCASKGTVRILGESLRVVLRKEKIKVNIICPGFVKTPMTDVNPFPMPFRITADKAAIAIHKGLYKNHKKIEFPIGMQIAIRFMILLPDVVLEKTLKISGGKAALKNL
jgi:NADP-dependent 3-hydroxy acid dehydrogenase YdfG